MVIIHNVIQSIIHEYVWVVVFLLCVGPLNFSRTFPLEFLHFEERKKDFDNTVVTVKSSRAVFERSKIHAPLHHHWHSHNAAG